MWIWLGILLLLLGACNAPAWRHAADGVDDGSIEPAAGSASDATEPRPLVAWPPAASCADLVHELVAMDAASAHRLDGAASPLGAASVAPGTVVLRVDLPVPQVAVADLGSFDCALVVGPASPLPAAADRVLDQRTVQSSHRSGTRRGPNPEHHRLERELAAARRAGTSGDVSLLKTGDPMLDLIGTVAGGIIDGIDAFSADRDARRLETALAATPAFIDEPIEQPYSYTLSEIEAQRRAFVPIALHDRAAGTALHASVTVAEQRRFAVAVDRHPGDVGQPQLSAPTPTTPAELDAWRQATPTMSMRTALAHIAGIAEADGEPTAATLDLAIAATRATRPDRQWAAAAGDAPLRPPRPGAAASTAAVGSNDIPAAVGRSLGALEPAVGPLPADEHGTDAARAAAATDLLQLNLLEVGTDGVAAFYITAEHIVVPAEAVGRSSLVAVRYPDGMRAHGLVELIDGQLGLALVYLPRRGEPLPLHRAPSPAPDTTSPPGMPWVVDGGVSGLFVSDAATSMPRWIDATRLDRFVARLDTH